MSLDLFLKPVYDGGGAKDQGKGKPGRKSPAAKVKGRYPTRTEDEEDDDEEDLRVSEAVPMA